MTNRDVLCDMGYEDLLCFENPDYDSAIIGVSNDGRVVYNFNLMVEHLVVNDNMSVEDAMEFIEYNTIRSIPYAGELAPIVVYDLI